MIRLKIWYVLYPAIITGTGDIAIKTHFRRVKPRSTVSILYFDKCITSHYKNNKTIDYPTNVIESIKKIDLVQK